LAIVTTPVRLAANELVLIEKRAIPFPLVVAPLKTEIHGFVVDTPHAQPAAVLTVTALVAGLEL
jgi:hypothetical protein